MSARRSVCLLAKIATEGEELPTEGTFANVVELSDASLVIESARELEPGDALRVSFYLPIEGGRSFARIALGARVDAIVNRQKMLYSVEFQELGVEEGQRLAEYVAGPPRGGG